MKEYRVYLYPISWVAFFVAGYFLLTINWIFALIFLGAFILFIVSSIQMYMRFLVWPYEKIVDVSLVKMKEVEIPSTMEDLTLNGIIFRDKRRSTKEKQPGILFHHGYTAHVKENLHYIIPLALNGFTVLAIDARGHGQSRKRPFNVSDLTGIVSDVENEIDYLESIKGVDKDRLIMIGHSLGAVAAMAHYGEKRLKMIISMSGTYDLLEMFKRHKTRVNRSIKKRLKKSLKAPLSEWDDKISAKVCCKKSHPIPPKERIFLVHCRNDRIVPYTESLRLKDSLNLPDENVLFLNRPKKKFLASAHRLVGQSPIVSDFLVRTVNRLKT